MISPKARHVGVLAVSAGVIAVILWRVDPRLIARDFKGVHWSWVVVTALLNIVTTWLEAERWRLLAKPVAPAVRLRSTFYGLLVGTVGNVLLPFKLGDGARAYAFAEDENIPFAAAVSTVVLDRILDVATFVALAALTIPFAPLPAGASKAIAGFAIVVAILFALTGWGRRRWKGLSAVNTGRLLVPALGISLMSWIVRFGFVWTMFQAFDLSLPLAASAVLQVVINVGIAVVGTPGNIGSFELACMGGLALFGVPADVAFSFGAALHVTEVAPIVALGLVMMWAGRRPPQAAPRF
jgi:uncharacterized membrane protein YbhN (UPF0104 family)